MFDIQAPAVGPVISCTISVRVAKHAGSPLYVELAQHSIDYLRRVVQVQIDQGDIHRKRTDRPEESKVDTPDGYSFSYRRNKLVKKSVLFANFEETEIDDRISQVFDIIRKQGQYR